MDFSKINTPQAINKDFILSKISNEMIFAYYHGPFELRKVYNSKLRKDKHASCGFYYGRHGKIMYKDLSTGEKYDSFRFVSELYSLSFSQTIKKISYDFGLVNGNPNEKAKATMAELKDFHAQLKRDTKIHFEKAVWTPTALEYWKQYHITKRELEENHIYNIKTMWINGIKIHNPNNEPRFAETLTYKKQMLTKVISPFSPPEFKWITNIPIYVPFGTEDLGDDANCVFLAKSAKCRIVLKKFLPVVIALQNESLSALSDKTLHDINFYYDAIPIYNGSDNDERGLQFAEETKQHGIIPAHLPVEWNKEGIKDYSDLSKIRDLNAVEQYLKLKKII